MATILASKTSVAAKAVTSSRRSARTTVPVVRAQLAQGEEVSRRALLGLVAGVAAGASLVAVPQASEAAYGDSANVFGKTTNKSGFVPYAGEGFALLLPSKWNPSKEQDFANVALRYEDNFDAVNNVIIIKEKTDKKSVEDFGTQDKFLESVSYLFGKQAFAGQTMSEGGFAANRVSAASLLDEKVETDKKGKKIYKYELLVRSADGDEGGRHQLISGTVGSDGYLYICKVQCGDKRWFKGVKKEAVGAFDSFTVV